MKPLRGLVSRMVFAGVVPCGIEPAMNVAGSNEKRQPAPAAGENVPRRLSAPWSGARPLSADVRRYLRRVFIFRQGEDSGRGGSRLSRAFLDAAREVLR